MARGVVKGGLNDGGSNIKSIQRGTTTIETGTGSTNITIDSVNPLNSIVIVTADNPYGEGQTDAVSAELTSGTNIYLYRSNQTAAITTTISWQVIEYYHVKSKQTGTTTCSTSPTNVTISEVDLSKSILIFSYHNSYTSKWHISLYAQLTSSTNLQFKLNTSYITSYVKWQIIEFD